MNPTSVNDDEPCTENNVAEKKTKKVVTPKEGEPKVVKKIRKKPNPLNSNNISNTNPPQKKKRGPKKIISNNVSSVSIQGPNVSDSNEQVNNVNTSNSINETIRDVINAAYTETNNDNSENLPTCTNQASEKMTKNQRIPESKAKKLEKYAITWPPADVAELIKRMELCIPANDHLRYKSRVSKLDWYKIAFKNYTVEECQSVWTLLEKKVRCYRLLSEVLHDAQELIQMPEAKSKIKKAIKRHPDMPKRPPSSYFIFYVKNKDQVASENPGVEMTEINKLVSQMYKNLPPETRESYETMAAKGRKEYEEKLEQFYKNHPDATRVTVKKKVRVRIGRAPKPLKTQKALKFLKSFKDELPRKPHPPFRLFYLTELKNQTVPVSGKSEFRENCRERWKDMTDKQKLVWINLYEEEYAKYDQALREYVSLHPEHARRCSTLKPKPVLSKEEVSLKDRLSGKPPKPPNSAYSLFSRTLLQSEEIKLVPVKERLNYVSTQWRNSSEEEKTHYRDLLIKITEQYKKDFDSYLDTLPEDKRKIELQNNVSRKRRLITKPLRKPGPVKRRRVMKPRTKKKFKEPEQPPISAFKYFATLYKGEEPVAQAWKALSIEEREKYEKELIKKKQEYIVQFEKFLKSLTKEELEAFSNSRKQKAKPADDDADEADDDDENSEDESESSSSSADESEEGNQSNG